MGVIMELSKTDKIYLDQYLAGIKIVSDSSLEMNYDVTDLDFKIIGQSKPNSYSNRITEDGLVRIRGNSHLDFYRQKAIDQQRVIKNQHLEPEL